MRLFKPRYITLQDSLSEQEQAQLAQAITAALPPQQPSEAFVRELERRLLLAARRQAAMTVARHEQPRLGIIGGGMISVVGGLAVWLYLNARKNVTVNSTTA